METSKIITKKDLVKYATDERNKLLYSICFDENDFNSLKHYVGKIISQLDTALHANPKGYVNLEIQISKLKTELEKKQRDAEVKYLCREVRQEVLIGLKKIITDNSQKSETQK